MRGVLFLFFFQPFLAASTCKSFFSVRFTATRTLELVGAAFTFKPPRPKVNQGGGKVRSWPTNALYKLSNVLHVGSIVQDSFPTAVPHK